MTACLAIDVGGTKIAAALVTLKDKEAQVAQRIQIHTPQNPSAEALDDALAQVLQTFQGQFDKVSVASTGIIQNGILTALNPKNLGNLAFFPLEQSIAKHTDKPITLLNDAQAAGCAEFLRQDDVDNFAFITVSTGVGGGIILNRKLFTGTNGVAGHIGHSLADPNGEPCGCGRVGCVEAIAAGRAIARDAAKWENPCEPPEVFNRFRQGNPQAVALVDKSAKAIAHLIADLKINLDIQRIALGGSVGLAEGYLARVEYFLAQMPEIYRPNIVLAHYAQDAGLIGAAWWAENQF
ncbi:N-acetylmannosamine kinase [Ursidibacter maritimus]|uniref:N-acetylmannosamine kinase n=1 Tax=Ursidibacter maritimus TaxID=1331689 RepID=A0A949WHS0_9PAST|nr:N-acetylmannosamine kinase [Ursidibacter maritimus]KAE9541938.1 N-acetylmannosamine kinase [Ursidibacter maritimus]MBV6523261.1 N-acetylmannosamine kinase [Ursidibacter maritimus]MBV6525717.1 N-acetylmannosamine kinase [Ursidibacter maritimus]MBV6527387.1 N-acetylmannosamine kinase [Ursidibacter maritimus]MBV6529412.1 N-acetylmannosamine kinase [Ursidibacter maritimus]